MPIATRFGLEGKGRVRVVSDEQHPAMGADIGQCPNGAALVAHNDQGFAEEVDREIVAGVGDLLGPAAYASGLAVLMASAVNVHCGQYDAARIDLALHGRGPARLIVRSGDFAVEPGSSYAVNVGGSGTIDADAKGALDVSFTLDGPTNVVIQPATQE